ncbi:MAG TPA: flagellar protein FlaG [Epulopiscium sp.]|nr:flagellar protein FlaG [Candidatus Epulonipiscium sp.]
MRIEGASQQSTSYESVKKEPVQSREQVKPASEIRTSSVEIRNFTKQTLGYQPTMQEKLIMEAIEKANQKVLGPGREFEFAIHKKTKQIMVKVLNSETKEIIREIPPEKVLDAVAYMCELAGIFVDEKR